MNLYDAVVFLGPQNDASFEGPMILRVGKMFVNKNTDAIDYLRVKITC